MVVFSRGNIFYKKINTPKEVCQVVQSKYNISFEPTVYMTVKEVSNYFKIGANSAHKFAQIGLKEGFVFKNGNKYIFDAKKFETYLFQLAKH